MKFVFTMFCSLVLILILSTVARAELWAFLVAGGYGWSNYHREADVCNLYQILRSNGVPKENIILMMPDTIAYHEKNLFPGTIQYYPDGPNVYEDVIVDYAGEAVTTGNFFKVLSVNQPSLNETEKIIKSNDEDTVLLYISSLGWYRTLLLNSRQMVTAYALSRQLIRLRENLRFKKMLIFLEVNGGAAFFNEEILPTNIGVFGLATTTEELPRVCYENEVLDINGHASCYSSIWTRLLQQVGVDYQKRVTTIFDYYQISREKFQETFVDFYGQLDIGRSSVKDFFGKPKKQKERRN